MLFYLQMNLLTHISIRNAKIQPRLDVTTLPSQTKKYIDSTDLFNIQISERTECMYHHRYSNHYHYNDKEQECLASPSTTGFILLSLGKYPVHYVMGKSLPCLWVKEALSQYRCSLPRKDSTLWSWEVCRTLSIWCCSCFSVLDRRSGTCFFFFCIGAQSSISGDVLEMWQQVVVCSIWAHFKTSTKASPLR